MRTLVHRKDAGTLNKEELGRELSGTNLTLVSGEPYHDLYGAWADKTDRQLRFPHGVREGSGKQEPTNNPARTRWLEVNDVHTQFLDAGIGCCWFAEKGDQEPVSGDTEDEAIARLAQINGLDLWADE